MPAVTKNVLIFGGTGLIGSHISRAIIASKEHFDQIALFTSPGTAEAKSELLNRYKAEGVKIIIGDLNSADDIGSAYNGVDTVVSCVGRQVIQAQVQLVKLADEHPDVKRFFPSEYGTDIEYCPSSKDEPPHQQKLKVRAAMKDVKDLDFTYVVTGPYGDANPGLYLSALPVEREVIGTFDIKRKRAVVLGDGEGKVSLTTMRDVGKLVVAALLHPEVASKKALRVNSFTATPKEIVGEFERQTGGSDTWDVAHTGLDEIKQREKDAWARKDPAATSFTLRRIWAEGGTLYDKRDNALIEMDDKVDSLEDAVKQAVEVQKSLHKT